MRQTVANIFFNRAERLGSLVGVRYKEGRSPYRDLSWKEFARLVKELAFGLAALGFGPGGRAAIVSQTSHLWVAADLSILSNGAASVPVYPTSSQSDLQFILSNSDSEIVFVQNEALLNKVLAVKESLPLLKKIVLLSALSKGKSLADLTIEPGLVIGLEELQDMGRELEKSDPNLISARSDATASSDCATVIYTSGTTGTPKGVVLTHSNIVTVLEDLQQVIPIDERDVYLSFLPMSHVFERICGEFYWLYGGGVIAFAEGMETIARNMAEIQPTMILTVPRVLDRIYAKLVSGIQGASPRAQRLIGWAIEMGAEMCRHSLEQKAPSVGSCAKFWLADKLVLRKLRDRVGNRLRMVVTGGAPASKEVIVFFNALGISTLEGYGLTETTAPLTVNRLGRIKAGTVGTALPSVSVTIGSDGEILVKGPSVFSGYFKDESATESAFIDGWFRTGDIGVIDQDGYLKITDRKKDLIVNSSGKNIAPQKVEAALKTIPGIMQAVVFGDKRKILVALLTLDQQAVTNLASEKGWTFGSYAELSESPQLQQYIKVELEERSRQLADFERVRRFAILSDDLSVEAGELTATLKIRRNVVATRYRDVIDGLYKEDESSVLVNSRQ